jgi:DNA ligase 1
MVYLWQGKKKMTEKLFKPMRSVAPDTKYPVTYPKLMSRKLDGIRCCIYKGKALTKSGKPVPNVHIRNWLEQNVPDGFDGELISGPPNLGTTYGTTFSAVMTQKGEPDFDFYVFDVCTDLVSGAAKRKETLMELCKLLWTRIKFVDQQVVNSDDEVSRLNNYYLAEGYEGAILVDPAGLYKYGKATAKAQEQLKMKQVEDFEARILDTYEAEYNGNESFVNEVGETKRSTHAENKTGKGMVGGYRVQDLLTGAIFNVGAGKMTHPERIAEWEAYTLNNTHRLSELIKYRSMTYGDMTNGAARHGRWIGWRDKSDMNIEDLKLVENA